MEPWRMDMGLPARTPESADGVGDDGGESSSSSKSLQNELSNEHIQLKKAHVIHRLSPDHCASC